MPEAQLLRQIQPFAYAIVFVGLYIAEHIYPQRRDLMDRQHDIRNILIGLLNLVLVGVAGYFFQQFVGWTNARGYGLLYATGIAGIPRLMVEFFLLDCFMYWWHRANHLLPLLWRYHAFHHVDEKMNSTTALRFHTVELGLSFIARMVAFPALGISVAGFLLYGIVFTSNVLFHHSSIRLPIRIDLLLRRIVVTPHMHRIHHSVIAEETDSNFSSVFSFWDRLFGTYRRQPRGPIKFGIPRSFQKASPTVK